MRIESIKLKEFKRFRTSGIREFEAKFVEPVVIITGSNNSGKSSLLKELCPLPSVRTDYGPNGYKELNITHEGHYYKLTSNFINRTSPHSFVMDGTELNVSGSTDVQTELVEKHFGITPIIRNLIYSKITLCQTTRTERKNLFLNINPLDLGLILDTHKKTLSGIKEYKSQLNLLVTRKTDLEARMLTEDDLAANKFNKDKLTRELMTIDKIIYGLEQHIGYITTQFAEDIRYRDTCRKNNTEIIPGKEIISKCKEFIKELPFFTDIPRDDTTFYSQQNLLQSKKATLVAKQQELRTLISKISDEINEYTTHLEKSIDRPVNSLEDELKEINIALSKYPPLPETPIPKSAIATYIKILDEIRNIVFIFRDAPVKMLELSTLRDIRSKYIKLSDELSWTESTLATLAIELNRTTEEINTIRTNSGIPENCIMTTCGLKNINLERIKKMEASAEKTKEALDSTNAKFASMKKEYSEYKKILEPIDQYRLEEKYCELLSLLKTGYFNIKNWDTELIDYIQNQPTRIVAILDEYIRLSDMSAEKMELENRKQKITTELEAIMKSSGASTEFLQKKISEKNADIKTYMSNLNTVEKDIVLVSEQCDRYTKYSIIARAIKSYQDIYAKGERALVVSKALEYWTGLLTKFQNIKHIFSEEVRKLESLVREQDMLHHTYQTEIMKNITEISKNKLIYEKIELALSPNTGLPHKSMVKYLNSMINNVNYFLSQIWTSRMYIQPIDSNQPLDYNFRLEVGHDLRNDINALSDGQTEVMNLCWVLTILLQMKLLNKMPLFADELGRTFDPIHRVQILKFLGQMLDNKYMEQLFLVNHYAVFTGGFNNSDFICLHADNIPELPQDVNEHVRITRY